MIARASRSPGSAGVTLVELLVAVSMFAGVMVLLVGIQLTGSRADQNMTLQDQVYLQAVTAAAHLRDEFETALVEDVAPMTPGKVAYRKLRLQTGGLPQLDAQGMPSWEVDQRVIELDPDGTMMLRYGVTERRLARLGSGGRLNFTKQGGPPTCFLFGGTGPTNPWSETEFFWPPDMLEAIIESEVSAPGGVEKNASYRIAVRFFLRNQHVR